ncbi:hypothetical protein [Humibacter ginsenosidimutans]|uniref:Uncharacterized protein n=1 Tax=Humibacter ginsenosidimutans TaxID=2599293 RepID=A0A5B8M866_9MICO|nr:hypothetical protein [Humibacter ginsenosidimutans]QDZ15792.1 hypothetical protein FPZ11_14385 [Humibacter ginsenosidimutans]
MDDDEALAAKQTLEAAIAAYVETMEPGAYVESFVLLTHKLTTELEQNGQTMVGVLVKTGQSWVMTRGLLDIALEQERCDTLTDDDD